MNSEEKTTLIKVKSDKVKELDRLIASLNKKREEAKSDLQKELPSFVEVSELKKRKAEEIKDADISELRSHFKMTKTSSIQPGKEDPITITLKKQLNIEDSPSCYDDIKAI